LVTDDVKQSTDRHQNLSESRNHNQAKERTVQQVASEAQHLGTEDSNNEKKNLKEGFKRKRNGKVSDLRFKMYEKGPFSILLKVKRTDTPLVEGRKEKKRTI
jgi:hypothetical protein